MSPLPMHVYEADGLVSLAHEIANRWAFLGASLIVRNTTDALSLVPDHATAHLLRAKGHYWLGEWEDALNDFESAYRLDPNPIDANVLYMIGESHAQCEEMDLAAEFFSRSLQLDRAVFSLQTEGSWPWYLLPDLDESIRGLEWAVAFACQDAEQAEDAIRHLVEKYRERSGRRRQQGNIDGAMSDDHRIQELETQLSS